jgi:hypothetical protein
MIAGVHFLDFVQGSFLTVFRVSAFNKSTLKGAVTQLIFMKSAEQQLLSISIAPGISHNLYLLIF